MGVNVAKHLTPVNDDQSEMNGKTFWEVDHHDDSKVSIKMKTCLTMCTKLPVSKSFDRTAQVKKLSKKCTRQSPVLTKDADCSDRPVSVLVQMIPLEDIQDKETDQKEKSKKIKCSPPRTRIKPKQCEIGLKRVKLCANKCDIKISRVDLTHHLQNKRARVDLKRLKMPDGLSHDIAFNNNKVSGVGLIHLKLNPRTIKERKSNEEILLDFNKDHSDDMFDSDKPPNYVSKLNLMDSSFSSSSSDEESSDNLNNTPITKHVLNFGGWSAETPDHLRTLDEDQDDVGEKSKGKFSQLAFVHKTLDERKKQQKAARKGMPLGIQKLVNENEHYNAGCSTPKLRRPLPLQNFLSDLEPAFKNLDKSEQDISEDEIEPYFDEEL